MDLTVLADHVGDHNLAGLIGLLTGLLFGVFAQRSGFCLRAATIEFWRGSPGQRTAVWLFTFGGAVLGVQLLITRDMLDTGIIRQLASQGSLSGAIIGGILFGTGMILARGCASRLLVLSATGNLRALVAGLMLTVVAQASLRGVISPARLKLSSLWLIDASDRNLNEILPEYTGLVLGVFTLLLALALAWRSHLKRGEAVFAIGVGLTIVLGWFLTGQLASQSFEIIPVQSVTFTGPSADTLMALINSTSVTMTFSLGLVPGVFTGSLLASLASKTFRWQGFDGSVGLPRYLIGAALMGFGSMLAGGCAVGAGVTGGSVMALTAWVALFSMWVGAGLTDRFLDR